MLNENDLCKKWYFNTGPRLIGKVFWNFYNGKLKTIIKIKLNIFVFDQK